VYQRPPSLFRRFWVWILLAIVAVSLIFSGMYVWLNWTILQVVYERKAGLNWFGIVFYDNYTFILAALLALLAFNPLPGRSDLYEVWVAFQRLLVRFRYGTPPPEAPALSLVWRRTIWAFWQLLKWAVVFGIVVSLNGLPFLGNLTIVVYMALKGLGKWSLVPRILALPIMPASNSELIALMPTMEIQYRLLYVVLTALLTVFAVRLILKTIRDFLADQRNTWIRNTFLVLTFIMLGIIIGAPYWTMDITTPFDYIICLALFISFFATAMFFQLGGMGKNLSFAKRRRMIITLVALAIVVILGVNGAIIAGYRLNWNNNWIEYEWKPLTEKQIAVTRWSAGTEGINYFPISQVPTGNITKILSLVRQWDQTASYTKMRGQIGVNWMTLSDSDIIYVNNREYWVAPTTIVYPSQDWISKHLYFTHTTKVIVVDSHSGDFVSVTEAFGVKTEPLIYYGEGEGFRANVYTGVRGFKEIENVSYSGEPDYVLSGWQRTLWFLSQGQIGFAFSPPQESINMLYNRDVLQRVKSILIYGLEVDTDAYLVSDGKRLYYAVQIYTDYPMHSVFSASNYMRFLAVVLVDLEDGRLQGYVVGASDGFLVDFYKEYYPTWGAMPSWLIPQMRYPEALLGKHGAQAQLDIDFLYHVADPFIWRSGSDFYERPAGTEVHYILMTVENQPHFIGLQLVEFQASPGKNLAGLYVAYGGTQLGRINLYGVANATTQQLIGPTAAVQAFTLDEYVKAQLTLFGANGRTGNILLYSIGGHPYYFIPVYIAQAGGVITNMAFIGIIDATTGEQVATGPSSAQAYYALMGITPGPETGVEERLSKVKELFTAKGYSLVNATKINANVEIWVNNATYVHEGQWNQTETVVNNFIQKYVQKYGNTEVYYLKTDDKIISFGILVPQGGVVKLYYISVQYR